MYIENLNLVSAYDIFLASIWFTLSLVAIFFRSWQNVVALSSKMTIWSSSRKLNSNW